MRTGKKLLNLFQYLKAGSFQQVLLSHKYDITANSIRPPLEITKKKPTLYIVTPDGSKKYIEELMDSEQNPDAKDKLREQYLQFAQELSQFSQELKAFCNDNWNDVPLVIEKSRRLEEKYLTAEWKSDILDEKLANLGITKSNSSSPEQLEAEDQNPVFNLDSLPYKTSCPVPKDMPSFGYAN